MKTFRDSGGLWENHRIEDVATPEAWQRNRALVLKFYNERRKAMREAKPNAAHLAIASWQKHAHVSVITQNIDDLHEHAGSESVLHLHGELATSRSTADPELILPEIREGDLCPLGSQLRPHIVWFGEAVTEMPRAEVQKRRFRPCTTQSDPSLPVAKNELAKVPAPDRPNQIWVADITYIETQEGWLYLAGILDLYSRKVTGWNTSDSLATELVTRAWKQAWKKHRPDPGLLDHSDRGCQYASKEFNRRKS